MEDVMDFDITQITKTHWLTPAEQEAVIEALLRYDLLEWRDDVSLPLKCGGKTDIYVNLRNMRNNPEAIAYFTRVFQNPLLRLSPDRIAEVPQAVTPLSGLLSTALQLPLLTIREQQKEGRYSAADIIGEIKPQELICLFDDVITDGESKIAGYRTIRRNGATAITVVLVDRQQGWQAVFAEHNITMPVWSGLTLHDIRAYLVQHGHLTSHTENEKYNKLILALDGQTWDELLPLLVQLRRTGTTLKVNDLATAEGVDALLPKLRVYGRVMVDLKIHDIPNTLKNMCGCIAKHNPWALTYHTSAGPEAGRTVVETLRENGADTHVLGVTVLTSIDKKTGEEIFTRTPLEQVRILATIAWEQAGVRGFVCSPQEIAMLRELYPEALLVTPGVRSDAVPNGDQSRIATPATAIRNGADHIVGGRQFLNSPDPLAEIIRIHKKELGIELRS